MFRVVQLNPVPPLRRVLCPRVTPPPLDFRAGSAEERRHLVTKLLPKKACKQLRHSLEAVFDRLYSMSRKRVSPPSCRDRLARLGGHLKTAAKSGTMPADWLFAGVHVGGLAVLVSIFCRNGRPRAMLRFGLFSDNSIFENVSVCPLLK